MAPSTMIYLQKRLEKNEHCCHISQKMLSSHDTVQNRLSGLVWMNYSPLCRLSFSQLQRVKSIAILYRYFPGD